MRLGHIARTGHEQSHGVLGCRDDVALRSVDNHDATSGRSLNINVVEPDTGSADHDEFISKLKSFSRHLGG